jgi:hypothetical protein
MNLLYVLRERGMADQPQDAARKRRDIQHME